MGQLQWFQISERISESPSIKISKGVIAPSGEETILKELVALAPSEALLKKFRHEYSMLRILDGHGTPHLLTHVAGQSGERLIAMCDFGGIALSRVKDLRSFDIPRLVDIAYGIASAVVELHSRYVTHKSICPDHVLLNPQTGDVKLISLGYATTLPVQSPSALYPEISGLDFTYASPEQTGRMNRMLDYRTDLYSLGATFFYLFTGRPPFDNADPLDLIHSHMAKVPPDLANMDPRLPSALSDIVKKLLAKNPEDRYQSASGLASDLKALLGLIKQGDFGAKLVVGSMDSKRQFKVPTELYGRDLELAQFDEVFGRVSRGGAELFLVTGPSGIGKSIFVERAYERFVQSKGYFVKGKFDQFNTDVPYEPIFTAINRLISLILTDPQELIDKKRARILEAVGSAGQVLIQAFPDLEIIIGPQPPVPHLPEAEASQRFQTALAALVAAVSIAGHPVVFFFDDLQWADVSSLRMIEGLLPKDAGSPLLIAGAYRDNEIGANHPLSDLFFRQRERRRSVSTLTLKPLSSEQIFSLLKDTFKPSSAEETMRLRAVADLCYKKTNGNPFFLGQLLRRFVDQKFFWVDDESGIWTWDETKLVEAPIADNVVDLLIEKIGRLDVRVTKVLQYAALLGEMIDLQTLSVVSGLPIGALNDRLVDGVRSDMIIPVDQNPMGGGLTGVTQVYRFRHDRVQQAFYETIPPDERVVLHLRMGRMLASVYEETSGGSVIFSALSHIKEGVKLIDDPMEKNRYAALCLTAIKRAKNSGAHEFTNTYSKFGLSLIGGDGWRVSYELTLSLTEEFMISSYLLGRHQEMDQAFKAIVNHARHPHEMARVYEALIKFYIDRRNYLEAVDCGLSYAAKLGIKLKKNPSIFRVLWQVALVQASWMGKDIKKFIEYKRCEDPAIKAAIRVLSASITAAYFTNIQLAATINMTLVRLSLKYGNDTLSPQAYAQYGIVLACFLHQYQAAMAFGELARKMVLEAPFQEAGPRANFYYYGLVRHWVYSLKESIEPLKEAYRELMARGNYQDGHISQALSTVYRFAVGHHLKDIAADAEAHIGAAREHEHDASINLYAIHWQGALNLMGQGNSRDLLRGPVVDSRDLIAACVRKRDYTSVCTVLVFESLLGLLFEQPHQSYHFLKSANPSAIGGTSAQIAYRHYLAMAALGTAERYGFVKKWSLILEALWNMYFVRRAAKKSPVNRGHYYAQNLGELNRILGRTTQAIRYYQEAIRLSTESGTVQNLAWSCELYGRYLLTIGDEMGARLYIERAVKYYQQWGAEAKVQAIYDKYTNWFARTSPHGGGGERTTSGSREALGSDWSLDAVALVKASQSLSARIVTSDLLMDIMRITLENAGATRGVLILAQKESYAVKAVGVSDDKITVETCDAPLARYSDVPHQVVHYVIRTKRPLVLDDAVHDGDFVGDPYVKRVRCRSLICQPILSQGQVMGVLYLENHLAPHVFTPERVAILGVLSSQGAISIKNAEYVAEVAKKVQLEGQVAAAQAVQLALLPNIQDPPGVSIALHYRSADTIGGDWVSYDYDPATSRLFLCVGDVTGHGIPSALVTAAAAGAVKATVFNLSRSGASISAETALQTVAQAVNETVLQTGARVSRNMTMAFVVLDLATGEGALISAAHVPMMVARGTKVEGLMSPGPLLGMGHSPRYVSKRFKIDLGDRIFLFTDGLIQNRGPQGRSLKIVQLKEILSGYPDPSKASQKIITEASSIWLGQAPEDDCTYLILRWNERVARQSKDETIPITKKIRSA